MGVKWTAEQQEVIDARDVNLLVSAAAGSGKTAVLVERIITQLTRRESPLNVDRLLVVTYTDAAAAEMKDRVRDAIVRVLDERPDDVHMQRQATLIHSARIMTIHSFCLSVIREHFHQIDLDPGFRTAEEGELKLIKHDVVRAILEHHYAEEKPEFQRFVESFVSGRDDQKLEEIILRLFEFSLSYPNQEKWLNECVKSYDIQGSEDLNQSTFAKKALQNIRHYLADAIDLISQAIALIDSPNGPGVYRAALKSDDLILSEIAAQKSLSALSQKMGEIAWKRLPPLRKSEEVDEEKAALVKTLREDVKGIIKDLQKYYFYADSEKLWMDMKDSGPVVQVLVDLVIEFSQAFAKRKRSKNIIDFSDMEHLALKILAREEEEGFVPSEAAEEYQEQLSEIMIDEYQDSNLLQEVILSSVSSVNRGRYNIFMVGDVKQSIYRFRLARPELFMEKFAAYPEKEHCRRIDLHKNFRSRSEVLSSVNHIFRQIMTADLGGIVYDKTAELNVGAEYEDCTGKETEAILVHTDWPEDESENLDRDETERELEARAIAQRIKELVRTELVRDSQSGLKRPACYRDIVILTRSIRGVQNVFAEVLKEEGIPTYTDSKEGYFETMEIGLLLDYLKVLDNKRQDLPLAAVLRSPLAGLSDEALAVIRSTYPDLSFYDAVIRYKEEGEDQQMVEQLSRCFKSIEAYRSILPYTAIHVLLWRIINETGYGDYMSALPGGSQRKANIDMLIEKAASYETTSYKGLFHFVRYIEQLKKYEVDYGEASLTDGQMDAVRLMTIHKSKGLEFPIVIVGGMSKRFNTQDVRDKIVVHPDLGIGIDAIDLKRRTKSAAFLKKVIQKEVLLENMGEELRVLYVALTRAKEKLIMVGTVSRWEEKTKRYGMNSGQEQRPLRYTQLSKAKTYYDWVLPVLTAADSEVPAVIRHWHPEDMVAREAAEAAGEGLTKAMLINWDTKRTYHEEFKERLSQQFNYIYAYAEDKKLKLKYTVSELKQMGGSPEEMGELLYEEPDVVPMIPKFLMAQAELSGASRGSAYHKALELLDLAYDYTKEQLKVQLDCFAAEGKLTSEFRDCIRIDDLISFLSTHTAARMRKAAGSGRLWREQPFVLSSQEGYLVQGIIDVFFEEDDGLVVLDYKTDRIKSGAELRDKYHVQLDYYGRALEQLTGKKVKQKLIYAFHVGEEVEI